MSPYGSANHISPIRTVLILRTSVACRPGSIVATWKILLAESTDADEAALTQALIDAVADGNGTIGGVPYNFYPDSISTKGKDSNLI